MSTTASTSTAATVIAVPTPVMTHSSRAASDPLDDFFFGYTSTTSSTRTHDSRHDERRQSLCLADLPPPSYDEEAAIPLPEYTLCAPEPVTLAMYLFKFGFLFPPFWFFGAFILLSPLREPPADNTSDSSLPTWMPEKTEDERRQIIANIRQVELKWARRCLCACLILIVLLTTASLTAWSILHH